jgi:hypothetical protein
MFHKVNENVAQSAAKKRSVRCQNCGDEGHNKRSCLRNRQPELTVASAVTRNGKKDLVNQPSKSRRNIGEIDDESGDEYNTDEIEDIDDEEVDDWDPEELVWEEYEPARQPPPVNEDGTENSGWPKFKVDESGPNLLHEDVNTLDFDIANLSHVFNLFVTKHMWEKFVTATNSYGRLYVKGWKKDTDISEFLAFIGILIFLGMIGYPSRKELFGLGPCRNDFVRSVMKRDRFEQLLKAWHYEDYNEYSAEEIIQFKKDDPFWAIDSFCKDQSTRFQELYIPHQRIDVDEQGVPWKGRHKCRCYNGNKPHKRFLKLYGNNVAKTKYQLDSQPYRGRAEKRPVGVSATA